MQSVSEVKPYKQKGRLEWCPFFHKLRRKIMSRRAHLEQDMVSEQKHLFGFVSYRQGAYIGITILFLYAFVPYIFAFGKMIGGIITGIVAGFIFSVPIIAGIVFIAFTKHPQTKYFRDKHYLIVFNNRYEIGKWRKATNRNLKTFEEMGRDD